MVHNKVLHLTTYIMLKIQIRGNKPEYLWKTLKLHFADKIPHPQISADILRFRSYLLFVKFILLFKIHSLFKQQNFEIRF